MDAIKRLQDVYNLKPFDFTGGEYGIHTGLGSFMTAMDAYSFGRGAFVSEDMENTQQWMAESLRLMDMEPDNQKEKPNRFTVLDHLAWSSYQVTKAFNRPFPSCCEPRYESETKCNAFHMKISFVCIWIKTIFLIKTLHLASLS